MLLEQLCNCDIAIVQAEQEAKRKYESAPLLDNTDGIITVEKVQEFALYADKVADAKLAIDKVLKERDEIVKAFEKAIPSLILKHMKEKGDVILCPDWVSQDTRQFKSGPFAAYYKEDILKVESRDSFAALKQYIIERKNVGK